MVPLPDVHVPTSFTAFIEMVPLFLHAVTGDVPVIVSVSDASNQISQSGIVLGSMSHSEDVVTEFNKSDIVIV